MNNTRRKQLKNVIDILDLQRQLIEEVAEMEQEAFDNMPESFQDGEKGDVLQENADELEGIQSELQDLIDRITEIIEK